MKSEKSLLEDTSMKILITGGAGFIGSHLTLHHLKKGDSVWVVDNLSSGRIENLKEAQGKPGFRFSEADLLSWKELDEAVSWADAIFHLAAVVGQMIVINNPVEVVTSNIEGCERVLKAIVEHNKKCRLVISSTSEVYGSDGKSSFREDAPITFPSAKWTHVNYPLSKYVNETMVLSYVHQHGVDGVITRLFNTTGPNQTGRYGMVVPRFIKQAVKNEPITVYSDGRQSRSFCDIRDSCRLLDLILEDPKAKGEIFNVGNDREITILGLAELIKKELGSSSPIVHIPYEEAYGMPFVDTLRRRPDLKKVSERYQFKPEYNLETTIHSMVNAAQAI